MTIWSARINLYRAFRSKKEIVRPVKKKSREASPAKDILVETLHGRLAALGYLSTITSPSVLAGEAAAARVSVRVQAAGSGAELRLFVCLRQRQPRRQRRAAAVAASAEAAGRTVVAFDLGSYASAMTDAEVGAMARQLGLCYGYNRGLPQPFRLALCGLRDAAPVAARLEAHCWRSWVLGRHEEPPWGTWPAASLVYLSADAEATLDRIEAGDVLVIGGVVDHANVASRVGLARGVAEAHAVRTARLPLDGIVSVRKTSLTCLAVLQILANFAESGDWAAAVREAHALHCAPMRKYVVWH